MLFFLIIAKTTNAQMEKEWQFSIGILPLEQTFAFAILKGIKPSNPTQLEGIIPIGNVIISHNWSKNRFSLCMDSFNGYMMIKSKEVNSPQIDHHNLVYSGLLIGGRYYWSSKKNFIYSGGQLGGQLLFGWNNTKENSSIIKAPAFQLDAIGFRFGENYKWDIGFGFGSKGIINIAIAFPKL